MAPFVIVADESTHHFALHHLADPLGSKEAWLFVAFIPR